MMEYKGYTAIINYDDGDDIFHGRVADARDVITFEGATTKELRKAFHDFIEDYLELCKELGVEPERPFSGVLNLRLGPDLHRRVAVMAASQGKSLNAWLMEAAAREAARPREAAKRRIAGAQK